MFSPVRIGLRLCFTYKETSEGNEKENTVIHDCWLLLGLRDTGGHILFSPVRIGLRFCLLTRRLQKAIKQTKYYQT